MKPNDIVKISDGRIGWANPSYPAPFTLKSHECVEFFENQNNLEQIPIENITQVELNDKEYEIYQIMSKLAYDFRYDEESFDENRLIGLTMAEIVKRGICR